MYEINKEKLGVFIAQLRKEKGFTQKELADRLFLSNKAISKWETGASMPDTSLLIPLADLLGVTVTELLTYQHMESQTTMGNQEVESLVKTAITYTEEEQLKIFRNRKQSILAYFICLFIACAETITLFSNGYIHSGHLKFIAMSAFFGGYFCILAKQKLPTYYDENKVNIYSDGPFRMNVPGVSFNNSNWPHIVKAVRIWLLASLVGYPILCCLIVSFLPENMVFLRDYGLLILYLAGLFLPIYVVGKKYQ